MSWAGRTPPAMEGVELPDVPAWERPDELDRECDYFDYGLDDMAALAFADEPELEQFEELVRAAGALT